MARRKENHWFGPLKVILQEDKNVIWAVLGNKLFRIAPEHARPLSAVEEVKHVKSTDTVDIQQELSKLRSGNTRFKDIQQDPLTSPPSQGAENRENQGSERSGDNQPDNEPGISLGSSEPPASGSGYTPTEPPEVEEEGQPMPEMPAPENVPVPVDEDDDLFCEACTLTEDQVWRFEVNLDLQDIDILRNDPNPEQVAFIISASKKTEN